MTPKVMSMALNGNRCRRVALPGYAERDMHQLWQHCVATIAGLLQRTGVVGEQIKGIGISAQGKGLFL
jgi:L-xylulokinase